ncbi:hypothetical protein [Auraticoccus monumenti]|uniref:DUF1795 domain-containing protein n=1 Tax=Auraticoccus monumenti TaxID=675864 RepID=A0A1G7CUI0_9ACTN|nr:hypothetical protein [Auraticoccus monumenti]SDE42967.1 hypothetical protein SAMN04489747_3383 [Auraticoccus monumenti]
MSGPGARVGRPRFSGITTFTDEDGRYEFRHPSGWVRSDLDLDLDGVIVRPEVDDESTYFAVAVTDLGVAVLAEDLETLRAGFDDGVAQLPDVVVEASSDTTYNNIVRLERTFTFSEDGATRKRRVWALCADRWQFVVAFQGSTVEEFAYWLPMGNYCFTAFQLPHALWFATDPAVSTGPDAQG